MEFVLFENFVSAVYTDILLQLCILCDILYDNFSQTQVSGAHFCSSVDRNVTDQSKPSPPSLSLSSRAPVRMHTRLLTCLLTFGQGKKKTASPCLIVIIVFSIKCQFHLQEVEI